MTTPNTIIEAINQGYFDPVKSTRPSPILQVQQNEEYQGEIADAYAMIAARQRESWDLDIGI
jgi:hypothetical protein